MREQQVTQRFAVGLVVPQGFPGAPGGTLGTGFETMGYAVSAIEDAIKAGTGLWITGPNGDAKRYLMNCVLREHILLVAEMPVVDAPKPGEGPNVPLITDNGQPIPGGPALVR